jgi:hypothetical protein
MQVGAMFGLVFAIIVMIFVLAFGFGFIPDMMCVGNVGQINRVVTNIESLVDTIQSLDEGSSDEFRVNIPEDNKICFIDPEDPGPNIAEDWYPPPDLFIEEEIKSSGYNTWIDYSCGDSDSGYKIRYLVTNSNFCVSRGDRLLLTNIGVEVRAERIA